MPESPRVRAVVFDLDGLMFNTEEIYTEVGDALLAPHGKRFDQPLRDAMMGLTPARALQTMIDWHHLETTVEELQCASGEVFPKLLDARLAPMPGLAALLSALEAHDRPKGIATSSRRSFVDDVLSRFDFHRRFPVVLTAEDVTHGKPHPEIYQTAADSLGVATRNMLVLEDSQNGCRAAVAAGAVAVAVPGTLSAHHDFSGAALIADSLADRRIFELLDIPWPTGAADRSRES